MSTDELFELIRAAYERGYNWGQKNPDSRPFLNKAAYDYADKTTSALALRTPSDGAKVKPQETSGGFYRKCSADTPGAEWAEGVGYHVYDEQARIEGQAIADEIARNFVRSEPEPRLPTREEAAKAAAVLLKCNGYDLDVWTNGDWPVDTDFLRTLTTPERNRP